MNPILKNWRTKTVYGAVILLFAALYAVLFGAASGLSAATIAVNAAAYWILFGLQGLIIWSVLRYVIPAVNLVAPAPLATVAFTVLMVCLTSALESLTMYMVLGNSFIIDYLPSLPLRIFVSALGFISAILYFSKEPDSAGNEQPPEYTQSERHAINHVSVKSGQKIKIINTEDIEYIRAEGDYVAIIANGERWLKEHTMKHFEEQLPHPFVRIHRSYIVNCRRIVRIERYGNFYQVILRDGNTIRVSASGYKNLKERLFL